MGKKKKPFIDKKNASTYHLLHRSQRDVAGDVLTLEEGDVSQKMGLVLWPSPENKSDTDRAVLGSTKLDEWKQRLSEAGLLDRNEHEMFLKPITGTGTFLDASGRVANSDTISRGGADNDEVFLRSDKEQQQQYDQEDGLLEVERQFDSIPLTADCMDEEIAEALFGDFEEGGFEEINDDFVLMAAKEPENEEEEEFDFDAHVQHLMEKARLERSETPIDTRGGHDWGIRDGDFFSRLKPLHERQNEDDDDVDGDSLLDEGMTLTTTPGVVSALSPDKERALCEKFEETLAEYDSDEVGDCPEEDIPGPRPLEGDTQIEAALDDFLQEKGDEVFMQGTRHYLDDKRAGGSGYSALVGKQMIHASEINGKQGETNPADDDDVVDPLAPVSLPPKLAPPAEEILIDGQSYFSERPRNPFDCESILSTYSNLDNNPVTIGTQRRRRRKKKTSDEEDEEPVQQIRLSNKTGLPIAAYDDTYDDDDDNDDTFVSVNRGQARNRKETPEEKKARKALIKKERQMARIHKKATREVFREEFEKRAVDVGSNDIAGKTVFRFS